ncbi:Undecaprenyl-phosphate galactosephosphotransferase [Rubellimicrobium mesophilum DSM 19309]|uniref:Undecaprenyl-phosphate galactosephosphotransferase n=1 Tax=Rubellimicrobium mesophilum DSM 19309 TaxID=442562 RepID=A0A017HNB6_9RHOB|nr:sugar transferase [Rubellimicrobium mesophilum]EYD75967.1 Undecaprenyl-phosphate galactosephosphotransferase [Rubellimicrobium mesophilum DSM 19309]
MGRLSGASAKAALWPLEYRGLPKRILDVAAVLMCAPFVLPIIGLLAIIISFDGGRPFYCQARVGRNGRQFMCWKLRSMCHDSHAALAAYLAADPQAQREWETTQKLKDDPRVTRIGRILRKSSLDELPQLWNVLIGDMSLVGPRPMMPDQCVFYKGVSYYALRPGITGMWQVYGRNETAFADRAVFDDAYERELSFMTDLKLVAATIKVVLRGTGY